MQTINQILKHRNYYNLFPINVIMILEFESWNLELGI